MSNSLDPDSVSPDLGPNCLQRLSADNKSYLLVGGNLRLSGFIIRKTRFFLPKSRNIRQKNRWLNHPNERIFQVMTPSDTKPTAVLNMQTIYYTPPQTLFVVGILFSRCPCVRPSVTFCFLNILKSHCWIFIKPCKHVHICKTNTSDKKVRARGQFYYSYFPL